MVTVTPIKVDEFNQFQSFVVVQDAQPEGQEGHGFVDDQDQVSPLNTPLHEKTITFDNPFFTSLREDFFRAQLRIEPPSDGEDYGLTAESLLIREPVDLTRPEVLTQDQIVRDVEYIQYILRHAYIGEYVLHEYVDRAVQTLETLKQTQSITPKEFRNRVSEVFSQIPDGHLSCRIASVPSDEGGQPPYELKPSIEIKVRGRRKQPLQVPVIRIREMVDDRSEEDPTHRSLYQEFIDEVTPKIEEAPALIIDLRGNGGGDGPPREFISLLTDQPLTSAHIWRHNSPAATAMRFSQYTLVEQLEGREILPEEYRQRRKEFDDSATPVSVQWSEEFETVVAGRTTPCGRPVVVVIDSSCASACEDTVGLLRQIPGVIMLVGEHSSGHAHYGGKGSFILPNSKLRVSVGARYAEYLQNTNNYGDKFPMEKVGFQPDVEIPQGPEEPFEEYYDRLFGEITHILRERLERK